MKTNHTVFINDIALIIADVYNADDLKKADGKIVSSSTTTVEDVIFEIEHDPAERKYIYLSDNPEASWHLFLTYYTLIEASGGVVKNDKGEYLVIFRRGKWDLPKGKVEYDETPEEAGIREVEEECGVSGLTITDPLMNTFHTYGLKKKRILKKTHWYLMHHDGKGDLIPQIEEDIEKVEWMNAKKVKTVFFSNTYQSIQEVFNAVI